MQEMWKIWVQSLGREYSLEKEMATHSSILAWEFHGQRTLLGCSPWGHKESDTTEATAHLATKSCLTWLSVGFSRQECWSGLLFPSPGDFPDPRNLFNPGIKPAAPAMVPALQAGSLPGSPHQWIPLEVGLRWAQTLPLGQAVTTVTSKSTQRVWNIWFVKHYVVFRVKKLSFTQLPRHEIIYCRMKANV